MSPEKAGEAVRMLYGTPPTPSPPINPKRSTRRTQPRAGGERRNTRLETKGASGARPGCRRCRQANGFRLL
jgi:hypothetical protein